MTTPDNDKAFAGAIPELYDTLLVPMLFEPYAEDMVARLAALAPARVLEIAAGTGVVTRRMAAALPGSTDIVATDLNQPMLDRAAAMGTARPVTWRQADAMQLPFDDASFDAVVCQFGAMFFPDKSKAFAEARRVLRAGGVFLFSVWGAIDANDIARVVTDAMAARFPSNPPKFLPRTPYAYFDHDRITADLGAAGFAAAPAIDVVTRTSRASSALDAAIAFCEGTPLRAEIEERDPGQLRRATQDAAAAVTTQYGAGTIEASMQAHVVSIRR